MLNYNAVKRVIVPFVISCLIVSTGCNLTPVSTTREESPSVTAEPPAETLPEQSPSPPPQESPPRTIRLDTGVPQSVDVLIRHYAWSYSGNEWTVELQIPEALYNYYVGLPRPPSKNYSVYITHPSDDAYIKSLIDEIENIARQEQFSELEKVEFVTAFVQHLPYTTDSVTTPYDEYPRYPVETLVDDGGDCEDTSILLAALLNEMDYGVVLVAFPETADTGGHMGIGVLGGEGIHGTYFNVDGQKYFYVETTNTGWGIGDIPEQYEEVGVNIYEMVPTPILTHKWTGEIKERILGSQVTEFTVDLQVIIENLGSSSADDVFILAGFDAGGGKIWNSEKSQPFSISVDQRVTIELTLQAPLGKHTRLVIQVVDDGLAVDESHSEWFDT